ncbi:hypothetical protein Tdes44962_MAKER04281 [Teratosphaeria destructans]|uniref:Uncharacterized protein n=1 Tax=Teratosphaeria destructans TaxID=418781 RepID=A0A9W7SMU7_9PEZI|nr:hypothetical protein Tdes44962_MAKER04281 [Teratosphaeria destructans]
MPAFLNQDGFSVVSTSNTHPDTATSVSGISKGEPELLEPLTYQPPKPTGKREPAAKSNVPTISNMSADLITNTRSLTLSHNTSSKTESSSSTIPNPTKFKQQDDLELVIMMDRFGTKKDVEIPYTTLDDTWSTDVREEFRSRDFATPNAKWGVNGTVIHATVAYEVKNREVGKGRIHFSGWTKLARLEKFFDL